MVVWKSFPYKQLLNYVAITGSSVCSQIFRKYNVIDCKQAPVWELLNNITKQSSHHLLFTSCLWIWNTHEIIVTLQLKTPEIFHLSKTSKLLSGTNTTWSSPYLQFQLFSLHVSLIHRTFVVLAFFSAFSQFKRITMSGPLLLLVLVLFSSQIWARLSFSQHYGLPQISLFTKPTWLLCTISLVPSLPHLL